MKKDSRFAKILAIVFSLLMVVMATDIPMLAGTVAFAADDFKVTVIDAANSAEVNGATVTVIPGAVIGLPEEMSATTTDGKAAFEEITQYFAGEGEAFEATYKVVADGYETKTGEVTITADGFKVKIERATINDITVEVCDAEYNGKAQDAVNVKGVKEGDKVLYSTDGSSFTEELPKVTIPSDSKKVWVKVSREGYVDYVAGPFEAKIRNRTFEEGKDFNISAYGPAPYNGDKHPAITITTGPDFEGEIYWKIKDQDEFFTEYDKEKEGGRPTITEPGTVYVVVRVTGKYYETFEKTYEAVVTYAEIEEDDYTITKWGDVTYDKKPHKAVEVKSDIIKVEYSTNGKDYSSAVPEFVNASPNEYKVWVKLSRKFHNEKILGPYSIKINKATIEDVEVKDFTTVYKSDTSVVVAPAISGLQGEDKVTYSKDGAEYFESIEVSEVSESGKYYVKIDRGSNYEIKDIGFNVTVEKADLKIAFDNSGIPATITYKEDNHFVNTIASYAEADGSESKDDLTGFVVYSLVDVDGKADAAIDAKSGKVTYTTTGNIKVKAEFKETEELKLENYNLPDPAYYEIEVVYVKAPKVSVTNPVTILPDGDETDKRKHIQWYNNDVEIKSAAEGWEIIEGSNVLGQGSWSSAITKSEAGEYKDVKVAYRNEAGEITALQTLAPFAIDKISPEVNEFEVSVWEESIGKTINFLTFGIFANDNVKVKVKVSDTGTSSGIKEVALYINDASGALTTVTKGADDIKETENGYYVEFALSDEDISEDSVYVVTISAEVTDNVGNKSGATPLVNKNSTVGDAGNKIMIDREPPVISDTFHFKTDDGNVETEAGNIYKNDVIGYIAVQDVHSGILSVEITDNGAPIDFCLSEPLEDEDDSDGTASSKIPQGITDKFTVEFYPRSKEADADGKHTIVVTVTDCAGNVSTKTGELFRDATAPVITDISFAPIGGEAAKNEAVDKETEVVIVDDYGYYFNKGVIISVTAEDIASDNEMASGVKSITLKTVDISGKITEYRETIEEKATTATVNFKIKNNFKGQIYVTATDIVGNNLSADKGFENEEGTYNPAAYNTAYAAIGDAFKGYVYPSGAIIEGSGLHSKSEHIEITLPETPYAQSNGIPLYNANTAVTVVVNDEYSGVRQIQIFADDKELESVVVANSVDKNSVGGWKITARGDRNLVTKMTKKVNVSINRNDIDFVVRITDRAGNVSEQSIIFGIDKTAPDISISYGSETNDEQYSDYFRTDRTATVTIIERNFNAEDVKFKITNTDGSIPGVKLSNPGVWTTKKNSDPDKTTHTAVVKFTADGDYTFDVSYTDMANHAGNDVPEQKFTIDKTIPVVTVTYDNNSARNGNYYKEKRTATITIKEHNFDASRASVIGTSTDCEFPKETNWRSDGDVHTATISYTADSKYTFDINFRDKAGNSIADFAQQEFYVDTTMPEVYLTGIVDKSANAGSGDIGFVLGATDKNFDTFEPTVTAVLMKDGKFTTKTLSVGSEVTITNGKEYKVKNLDEDGIYSVSCTVVDKAGNTYNQVMIEKKAGNMAKKSCTQAGDIVTFSVNRNGSVFALDSYTSGLTKDYYIKDVTDFVTIIEINADPVVENSITINGKALKEKTDYTVTLDNKSGSWYKYTYKVNKNMFETEGQYNVIVSSKDKAENAAFSDVKDAEVEFIIDRTAPVVTVSGMETNGKYRTTLQKVLLVPKDDGGYLKSVTVRTVGEDGKALKTLLKLEGEELRAAVEAGEIYFNLEEGVRQKVQIICEDYAGNISGMATEECYSNVTVSSNAFTIFWATDEFRWATIIGAVLLAGIITVLIVRKRKKKAA